jgi:uncharacterized protein YvpB
MSRLTQLPALLLLVVLSACAPAATASSASPSPAWTPSATYSPLPVYPHVATPKDLQVTAAINTAKLTWVATSSPLGGFYLVADPGNLGVPLDPSIRTYSFANLSGGRTYTFTLYAVGLDQVSLPVTATIFVPAPPPPPVVRPVAHSAPVAPSTTHIISGVPQYYQLPLSCEETATSMALVHQGLHVSTQQILSGLGVDNTPISFAGGLISHWGDPDKAFVGNVYGSENHAPYGYQSNPNALVRVIKSYGGHIVEWSEPGYGPNSISAAEIYHQIQLGHPVVAYATWDWHHHTIHYYTDEYGHQIANIYPYDDHVYVVTGVNATSVEVHDPIRGTYWVSKSSFAAAYEFGMAIVLQ